MNAQTPNIPPFFITAFFAADGDHLQLVQLSDPQGRDSQMTIPRGMQLPLKEIEKYLDNGPILMDFNEAASLPPPLTAYPQQLGCVTAAYVPILQDGQLRGLVLIGGRAGQELNSDILQAFSRTIRLAVSVSENHSSGIEKNSRGAAEIRALNGIGQHAATISSLDSFYTVIHNQVRAVIGDFGFVIGIYNSQTNSINIPYLYEEGEISHVDSFPLGEGLTSIIIRTREPLMLVKDVEKRALGMGAKIVGKPAKSWLGVPLLARNEAIGAIIIQDFDNEQSFNDNDLKFLTAVANQAAGAIYNARLLNESQQNALQLETAAEIARDINSSRNLDELLQKAVELIHSRLHFYHAGIFLIDASGESIALRAATGEAGLQLKRTGHKLGIGSKSILGHVAGKGERLIVNDAPRDSTQPANTFLPETKSQAAIPLKIGERILGVLDVQSKQSFAFSKDNLRTLQILADQLAIAVVNSELFAETQEHLAQHRLLHHITSSAASGTTLEDALQSAVNGLQVTLGGDRVTILLADREKKFLDVKAAVGYAQEVYRIRIPIGSGITGWAAAHRKALRVNNVENDTRYIAGSPNIHSEMAIPLIYRSELLGILNVESEQPHAYAENDEELLGTLGGSLAAIIANARLLEQIRSQAERERVLYEITDKIRRTTDMQTILATTVSELTRAVGASRAGIKIDVKDAPSAKREKS